MRKPLLLLATIWLHIISCTTDNTENPENASHLPSAKDDITSTAEDVPLIYFDYLDNDIFLDNMTVSQVDEKSIAGGTISYFGNVQITYEPPNNFSGQDSFTYTICDDNTPQHCSTATILVNVIDGGTPVAQDDIYGILAGQSRVFENLLGNDLVVDEAEITQIDTNNTHGQVELTEDGAVIYTPHPAYAGDDIFYYTLCDNDQPEPSCTTAKVLIQVLEPITFNIPEELEYYYGDLVFIEDGEYTFDLLSNFTIANHTRILSYGQRHNYLYNADADLNNQDNVILMYSGESRYWKEYTSPSNSYYPQTFNTEHIFPQSKLATTDAVTDLHHLRVCDEEVNSDRSNYPYVDGSGSSHNQGSNWFPGDNWKGDVARMVLYLNIRYFEDYNKIGNLDLFLKWNVEDPVSAFEMQRNQVIESAQGNRNPFIDNPYLATLIWGGSPAENRWE